MSVHISRRSLLTSAAAGAAVMWGDSLWAQEMPDPRTAGLVAKTIGIDTHNHIDVPLTDAEMPGPDIDLRGEMKRSGLSAICMLYGLVPERRPNLRDTEIHTAVEIHEGLTAPQHFAQFFS
jgi:membrane dipeptidase